MNLVTVVGGRVVAHRLSARLDLDDLRGPQCLQHGIEPLPRPLQQAAEAMDGDPLRGWLLAIVGSAELLPEAFRVQEPSQLLVLVEPIA
jgi:hypothetical protein